VTAPAGDGRAEVHTLALLQILIAEQHPPGCQCERCQYFAAQDADIFSAFNGVLKENA
jgi:hypothetical protein